MRARSLARARGFTMTELMVVVAILGILAAVAGPNMINMVRAQKVKTAAFDVFSSLNFARSEAIKRNRSVTLTPVGGNWASGWQIADGAGTTLRDQAGWDDLALTGPATVIFASNGRISTPAAQFNLSATNVVTAKNRCISLDLSGRAVSREGAC